MNKIVSLLLAGLLVTGVISSLSGAGVSRDGEETISYEDQDSLNYFWWLPDDYGDSSFNVRFTPKHAPFKLKAIEVVLYNLEEWGDFGQPGMKVRITKDNNGYPGEQIAAFIVPYDSLYFSWSDSLVWDRIDFANYGYDNLVIQQAEDFHVVINPYQEFPEDTLAIFSDDGSMNPTDRSGLWNGDTQQWEKLIDNEFDPTGYNFAVHAVVGYEDSPDIEVDPMVMDFGNVHVNKSLGRVLTINDSGGVQLTVNKIVVEGDYFSTDFGDNPVIVPPGGNTQVNVTFAPTEMGRFHGMLGILSDDPATDTLFVPLDGTGAMTVISSDSESVNFGNVPVDSFKSVSVKISNKGNIGMTITGVDADDPAFDSDFQGNILVPPDSSCRVNVSFSPAEIKDYSATLSISQSDSLAEVFEIPLRGAGVPKEAVSEAEPVPTTFTCKAYPNPFNATLNIRYSLPQTSPVSVVIYDLTGRPVTTLVNGTEASGFHTVRWNAENVPGGIYLLRVRGNGVNDVQKVVLLK